MNESLLEALSVTMEICGTTLSKAGVKVFASDLSGYPEPELLAALKRCRHEVRGRLTLADVIGRLPNGHPGVEEAWAMMPRDESVTVVWTEEMAQAFGVAKPLLDAGDAIGARMAFKEVYSRLVSVSRSLRQSPWWHPSLGWDPAGREEGLREAVRLGKLSAEHVQCFLPEPERAEPPSLEGLRRVSVLVQGLASRRPSLAQEAAGEGRRCSGAGVREPGEDG